MENLNKCRPSTRKEFSHGRYLRELARIAMFGFQNTIPLPLKTSVLCKAMHHLSQDELGNCLKCSECQLESRFGVPRIGFENLRVL